MENREERIYIKIIERRTKIPKIIEKFKGDSEYINPPIPEGFRYIFGEWDNGIIIEEISSEEFFCWQPVGKLNESDESFFSKYGDFVLESLKKYQGFYILCENIAYTDMTIFLFVNPK